MADKRSLYANSSTEDEQRDTFLRGDVPVAVYGLGKMGLPLASVYADVCGNVVGADIDESVVAAVNKGDCPVQGEPGLQKLLERMVEQGALQAVNEPETAAECASVHVIIVPTLITDENEPDLSLLEAATTEIGKGLTAGDMVIVESTVPPRTCADVVQPILKDESGLASRAFGLAFCPERTSSGRALKDIRGAYPKIIGGTDDESTRVAELIYNQITSNDVISVSDASTAETVKVMEGLYRDVNIALANELATFTDELGVDIVEAIEAANTQPFCEIHTPGVGVGGHCIPYYPYFITKPFETGGRLLEMAREVNDSMPYFTAEKLRSELNAHGISIEDARILILGITYRPGVSETRATPAKPLIEQLNASGADVAAVDPLIDDIASFGAQPLNLNELEEFNPDGAVIVTAHEEFEGIEWDSLERMVVIDGRQMLSTDLSHEVYTIGRGKI